MSAGKEIGECLEDSKKHVLTDIDGNPRELEPGEKPLELSDGCKAFIKVNQVCGTEIQEHCSGDFFGGDLMTCLTEWTKPENLGEACTGALPQKKAEDEEVDAEKAAWRAQRKAARTQAMKDIKKEQASKEGGGKRRKRRKSKEL
jgi:hypothetical protein